MTQGPRLSFLIEKWCGEAVARWGDDWARIAEYIRVNFTNLSDAERAQLENETALTLLDPLPTNRAMH